MARIFSFVLKPAIWLVPLLFIGWTWHFRGTISPTPRYVVHTGAAYVRVPAMRPSDTYAIMRSISDDGSEITIGITSGDFRFPSVRLERWETLSGRNSSPNFWSDSEWQKLLLVPFGRQSRLIELLNYRTGREFLADELAWTELRKRFALAKAKALSDVKKDDDLRTSKQTKDSFPEGTYVSTDGKYVAYASFKGFPVDWGDRDSTAIEDSRTGRRIASLPGDPISIAISPDGQTAVTEVSLPGMEGEQPWLVLWDLKTSTRRKGLLVPDCHPRFEYTPNGKYIFASYVADQWQRPKLQVRWWDATTGNQVGCVDRNETAFMDNDRVLVTHAPSTSHKSGAQESFKLCFWDIANGAQIGEWDLDRPSDGAGYVHELLGSESGRYLAAVYDPDYGREPSGGWVTAQVERLLPSKSRSWPDNHQIILWDVINRREVARVDGWSAVLSLNGRWLATIDSEGVVRVWEVPMALPWIRILAFAAVTTSVCWAVFFGLMRIVRRIIGPNSKGRIASFAAYLLGNRRLQVWIAVGFLFATLATVAFVWYANASARAHEAMEAAYDEINYRMSRGIDEAEVTELIGRPPVAGPVHEMTCAKKGGGESGPATLRKWKYFGSEIDVYFGPSGKVKVIYINE